MPLPNSPLNPVRRPSGWAWSPIWVSASRAAAPKRRPGFSPGDRHKMIALPGWTATPGKLSYISLLAIRPDCRPVAARYLMQQR